MRKIFDIMCCLILLPMLAGAQTQSVEEIRVLSLDRRNVTVMANGIPDGYIEMSVLFRIQIPSALTALPNVSKVAETYRAKYNIDKIDTVNNSYYAVFTPPPVSLPVRKVNNGVTTNDIITDGDIKAILDAMYADYSLKFSDFQLMPFDGIITKSRVGGIWVEQQ